MIRPGPVGAIFACLIGCASFAETPIEDARPPTRPVDEPNAVDATAPIEPEETPAWQTLRESDQDFAACRLALAMLGTVYREIPPRREATDPDCGIARPIEVDEIVPGVALTGERVMRCDTARALGLWTRDFLRPAAAALPGAARLSGLQMAASYVCRKRVGTGNDRPRLSEHALGNAIDIAAFLFADREPLTVAPREETGDLDEAFQRTARASACLFFSTVLGPGTNAAHETHLHLDVIQRENGWRLCQ